MVVSWAWAVRMATLPLVVIEQHQLPGMVSYFLQLVVVVRVHVLHFCLLGLACSWKRATENITQVRPCCDGAVLGEKNKRNIRTVNIMLYSTRTCCLFVFLPSAFCVGAWLLFFSHPPFGQGCFVFRQLHALSEDKVIIAYYYRSIIELYILRRADRCYRLLILYD